MIAKAWLRMPRIDYTCTGTEVAIGAEPLLSRYDMSRSGYVPSWTCPEVTMSRNGYVPKRLCPGVAMSRNGYVPEWLCPETVMSRSARHSNYQCYKRFRILFLYATHVNL